MALRPSNTHGRLFVKSNEGLGGKLALKIDDSVDQSVVEALHEMMRGNDLLFQEQIIQAEDINRIYPHSINTIRIHTHRRPGHVRAEVFGAMMRVGVGGRVVDNGGLFLPIDLKRWELRRTGWSLLQKGGQTFTSHPDTGVRFEGFSIPHGNEIEELCQAAAAAFDRPFIGWDVALTPEGPTIIEGNHNPHLIMAQLAEGGIKEDKHFSPALNHLV